MTKVLMPSCPSHETTYDQLFSTGQIRLAEISVYNWGSFHELHTGKIDPDGTLITGDNGSGKSTFIDGLMALLLPAGKASFNVAAAQGDRSDRNLISYIRGSYGTEHDGGQTNTLNKRPGAVISGLRALYRGDDQSEITLAALFWMSQPSNALKDLNRLYLVGKRNVTLEELLKGFGKGNMRVLKQQLRTDPLVTLCDDRFNEYQETYRRLLRMDNRNAPALLSRALGLKKIDDLTDLIRKLVLEPSKVQENARKAVAEFDDLVAIHKELETARSQRDRLAPLPELAKKLSSAQHQIKQLSAQLSGLPVWFGEHRHRLWTARMEKLSDQIADCEQELETLLRNEHDAQSLVESRYKDYIQAGGDRIDALKKELEGHKGKLSDINARARDYQNTAKSLSLNARLDKGSFEKNSVIIDSRCENLEAENRRWQDAFAQASALYANAGDAGKTLAQEIAEISARPDSNINPKYQQLRDELSASLNLSKSHLMFIGELIDVHQEHKPWQGAIERALGGLRTTLAVPESHFSQVTQWLNQRHTGLHVRVQVVRSISGMAAFKPDGYLKKLTWREHPYREWLKHHLARYDLHCVESTKILDQTPFSMTLQGLVHLDKGRFEKKDQKKIDDRRFWQLGFSNKDRLSLLQQDLKKQEAQIKQCLKTVENTRASMDQARKQAQLWEKLRCFSWEEINVPYWQNRVSQCQQELDFLQQSGGSLEQAHHRWEEAKRQLIQVQTKRQETSNNHAVLKSQKKDAAHAREKAAKSASEGLEDSVRTLLLERIGELVDDDLENSIGLQEEHQNDINKEKDQASKASERASNSAVGIMVAFRTDWSHVTADWLTGIDGLPDYIDYLEKLDNEGLPALVERFRERLNRHATQSLAAISQKMLAEREEIEDRIGVINQVLVRTEFKKGTHLRLGTKREEFEHVRQFKKQLRVILQQATSDNHEARFLNLKNIIEILDKATAVTTANNLESLRLLDSRYQLTFYAEEIDNASHEVIDVLASSTGKSGGEKESFAGTIVAASLAYVLTPDGYDKPIYSTVFLDEAFSNTAESVSRRVLKVFRELHIHINLITPYKNLNLARESARSLLIMERDPNKHESHLCEITWEEVDKRLHNTDNLKKQAQALNIEIEPLTGLSS